MKVAVLMSTYNGEKYIKEQIDSILDQTGDFRLDLWVRDDGSQDGTVKILQTYADRGELYWYTGSDLGAAHSFLDLIGHCGEYDYYAFADQDDYWMPGKVQSGINVLKDESGVALYFANAELVDSKLRFLGRFVYKKCPKLDFYTLLCAGGLLGCTMVFNWELVKLIRRECIPENIIMHDYYVSALCSAVGGKIYFDERPQIKYRQHAGNVIGMAHGLKMTIAGRARDIMVRRERGIAEQAEEIKKRYEHDMSKEYFAWADQVSNYRRRFFGRLKLACSVKTKYVNWNMGFTLRMSILLGNR